MTNNNTLTYTYDPEVDVFTASLDGRELATFELDYDRGDWRVTYGPNSNWQYVHWTPTEHQARAWIQEQGPQLLHP